MVEWTELNRISSAVTKKIAITAKMVIIHHAYQLSQPLSKY
jgi:hypothetical protein